MSYYFMLNSYIEGHKFMALWKSQKNIDGAGDGEHRVSNFQHNNSTRRSTWALLQGKSLNNSKGFVILEVAFISMHW